MKWISIYIYLLNIQISYWIISKKLIKFLYFYYISNKLMNFYFKLNKPLLLSVDYYNWHFLCHINCYVIGWHVILMTILLRGKWRGIKLLIRIFIFLFFTRPHVQNLSVKNLKKKIKRKAFSSLIFIIDNWQLTFLNSLRIYLEAIKINKKKLPFITSPIVKWIFININYYFI